jgi:hypothetical protein
MKNKDVCYIQIQLTHKFWTAILWYDTDLAPPHSLLGLLSSRNALSREYPAHRIRQCLTSRSDGQNLLNSGAEKKDNVTVSTGGSVTASFVGSLTGCLIRVATDVKWQALPWQVKQLHLNCKWFIHGTHKTHGLHGSNERGPIDIREIIVL